MLTSLKVTAVDVTHFRESHDNDELYDISSEEIQDADFRSFPLVGKEVVQTSDLSPYKGKEPACVQSAIAS